MNNSEINLRGISVTESSLLIRTGSWKIPSDMKESDLNVLNHHLYKSPRFKMLGSFIPALVIREFGVSYTTDIMKNFEQWPSLPFGISGLVPKVRSQDKTIHLTVTPDNKTEIAVQDELKRMRSELKIDIKLPAVYPVIASFTTGQHKELIKMADAFSEMITNRTTDSPVLIFESPVIRY